MVMPHGWAGKTLRVDLTSGAVTAEPSERYYHDFLGGKGINAKVLWDEVLPETAALSPQNRIAFGTGALVGTLVPTACKCSITAKSPVTGRYGDTNIGGFWPAELKFAGYDHLIISGRSPQPVYLFINGENVEIRDAGHLWGKDTGETDSALKGSLRREMGRENVQVLCIGQAGENTLAAASIVDWPSGCGSRTGMGAVMGSKNLKAVAVSGIGDVSVARSKELIALCTSLSEGLKAFMEVVADPSEEMKKAMETLLYGIHDEHEPSGWPGRNEFLKAAMNFHRIYGAGMPASCLNCPTPCKSYFKIPAADGTSTHTVLHCDTWFIFSSRIKATTLDFLADSRAYMKCQRYGVDAFSVAADVAFLMELYEKGIITKKDTDGIPMTWGSREALGAMIDKIAKQEGCGTLFSDGIRKAAERIGKGAEECAYHTKGLELLNHSLYLIDAALAGAVSQRGDQVRAHSGTLMHFSTMPKEFRAMLTRYLPDDLAAIVLKEEFVGTYEGKAHLVEYFERNNSLADVLGVCRYWMIGVLLAGILSPSMRGELLACVTGEDFDENALRIFNERVESLIRAFNQREGLRKEEDSIPRFYFEETSSRYGYRLDRDRFDKVIEEYYALRGWDDQSGLQRAKRLSELKLDYVAKDLGKRGLLAQ